MQQVRPEHQEQIRDMSSKIRLTFEEASEQRAQERYEVGKTEGKAEGKAEGEMDGCRTILCELLEKRFGSLSDVLRHRIEDSTDIEQLRACVKQVLDITSADELSL